MLFLFELVPLSIVLIAMAGGFMVGKRFGAASERAEGQSSVLEAAVLGMVALLIGFTFSFDATRYDYRRHLAVQEANAIGTTYLRAAFLTPPLAARARSLLTRYVDARLDAQTPDQADGVRDAAGAQSERLQQQLWAIASHASRNDTRPVAVSQFVISLNETIDTSAAEIDSLKDRAPAAIVVLLIAALLISGFVTGFSFGRAQNPGWVYTLAFALLSSFAVYTIADLDNPTTGLIQTSNEPLLELRRSIASWPQSDMSTERLPSINIEQR